MPRSWVVLSGSDRLRWGGDLRRRFVFDALETRTGATVVRGFGRQDVRAALAPHFRRRWELWRRGPAVVTAELLDPALLRMVERAGLPLAVDVHDEPVVQAEALGVDLGTERVAELRERLAANLRSFRWAIAQTESFRDLAGLPPDRTLIASNGTDTRHIDVRPLPAGPVVAFSSGASAGRGIETLIDAARIARRQVPDLRLDLWLVAVGEESGAYLAALRQRVSGDPWIRIAGVPYEDLPAALGQATVHCVPSPPHPYMDAVVSIKLFDSMAAGRPVVVTPRKEMRSVVEAHQAGVVAAGDEPADLAAPLVDLLRDPVSAQAMGRNARRAAEAVYDWRVIGDRLASELIARTG